MASFFGYCGALETVSGDVCSCGAPPDHNNAAEPQLGPLNIAARILGAALLILGIALVLEHTPIFAPPVRIPVVDSTPQPATTTAAPNITQPTPASSSYSQTDIQAIDETLSGWAAAQASGNIDAKMSYYAQTVDPYIGKRHVDNSSIRASKLALQSRGIRLTRFTISPPVVRFAGDEAIASLYKQWTTRSNTAQFNSTPSYIYLRRAGNGWQITGEADVKNF